MSTIATTHSSPTMTSPIMTDVRQDARFDQKLLIPRGLGSSVGTVVHTVRPVRPVQTDQLHHQNFPYGRTLSDQDLSFFDFEPRASPYQVQSAVSDSNETPTDVMWNQTDCQLLSPPYSAVFSPKAWPSCEHLRDPPPNVLTDIKSANSRTNYGQVTPTDDDHVDKFNPPEPQPPRPISSAVASNKKRKRTSASIPESTTTPASKRSRKDGNRLQASGTPQADPSNQDGNRRSRFLERNRLAASKCRQKKKQWVENLEVKARNFQAQFKHLSHVVDSLKEEILYLKVEMVRHKACEGSEIQKCIEVDDEAFAEAVERLEQLEREKSANGGGSTSPGSDLVMDPVRPTKDPECKTQSYRRSGSALPLDDVNLAEALLQEGFFPVCD